MIGDSSIEGVSVSHGLGHTLSRIGIISGGVKEDGLKRSTGALPPKYMAHQVAHHIWNQDALNELDIPPIPIYHF